MKKEKRDTLLKIDSILFDLPLKYYRSSTQYAPSALNQFYFVFLYIDLSVPYVRTASLLQDKIERRLVMQSNLGEDRELYRFYGNFRKKNFMEFYNIIVKFHDIYGTVGIKELL